MGRKLIYLDDVIEALIEKGQASKRYSLSEEWELNYTEICDVIEDLPSAHPEDDEWCHDCKEYDQEKHCCPRFNHLIRKTVEEVRENAQPERKKGEWINKPDIYLDEQIWECSECSEPWIFIEGTPSENNANFCPNCGADMRGEEE